MTTGYEERDVAPSLARRAGLSIALLVALVQLVSYEMYTPPARVSPPPMAEPALEVDNRAQLEALRQRQLTHLNSFGWLDAAHTKVHIPIQLAKQRLLQEGRLR